MKFRAPEGRGQKILRPTPVRDGVVRAPRLLTTEWKYGLARDEFLHTPRSRRQLWGAQAHSCRSVFYLTGPFESLFANNLSGGIDLQALLLALSILSGEPAGDQGTFLGKPPREENAALLCAHLESLDVVVSVYVFLYFALGPKSGVMSFFSRLWRRTGRSSWRLGAGFPGFRHKNQGFDMAEAGHFSSLLKLSLIHI